MDSAHRFQTFFYMLKPKWFQFVLAVKRSIQPKGFPCQDQKKHLRDDQSLLKGGLKKKVPAESWPCTISSGRRDLQNLLHTPPEGSWWAHWTPHLGGHDIGLNGRPFVWALPSKRFNKFNGIATGFGSLPRTVPNKHLQTMVWAQKILAGSLNVIGPTDCPTAPHGKSPAPRRAAIQSAMRKDKALGGLDGWSLRKIWNKQT